MNSFVLSIDKASHEEQTRPSKMASHVELTRPLIALGMKAVSLLPSE